MYAITREHVGLVRAVRTHHYPTTPTSEIGDIEAAGLLGLTQAANRYQHGHGSFTTYAWARIRGAMGDHIRRELGGKSFSNRGKPIATEDERLIRIIGAISELDHETRITLKDSIAALPPKQRFVMHAHHFHGYTFEECGEALGVTGQAAGRLAARARAQLRTQLQTVI